ncbi:hypothetical protein L596_004751 [Steinernema carpocapsae]|uniref:Paired domain-containing protein n=1 Tax=Steinernema carpocapsae TaxID=34508 RepID=A0A4U8UYA0_STECR|nr:hypothetical protein L596_004751 [Steinernema carpocapsae]
MNNAYNGRPGCSCVIDISTPATLERDFNLWLNGLPPSTSFDTPCHFSQSRCDYNMNTEVSYYAADRHEPKDKKSKRKSTLRKGYVFPCRFCNFGPRSSLPTCCFQVLLFISLGTGTNLYGRPYCPGRPLSMEERTQIIELHNQGMKVNAISKQLCISHGCVSKIISRFRDTGLLSPASNPDHRRPRRSKKPPIGSSAPNRPPVSTPPLSYINELTAHALNQMDVATSTAYM